MDMDEKTEDGLLFPHWVAAVCRETRELAGVSQSAVARAAGEDRGVVHHFEKFAPWPKNPERIVKGYAEACGLPDGFALWSRALKSWRLCGAEPEPAMTREEALRRDAGSLLRELDKNLGLLAQDDDVESGMNP